MEALTTSLVSGLTSIQGDMLSALGSIAPVAITVAGAIMVVTFGVKVFRRIAK